MKRITTLLIIAVILVSCSPQVLRIACIGDSITEGAGLIKQSETSYPVVLGKILGENYAVLNSGRSATTLQKNGDFSYWNSKEFSNTFVYKPNIIIIKLGTNDTKPQNWNASNFEKDYQSLIDTLKTIKTSPKIYLCLPVPVYKTEWGINDSTLISGVIPVIKKIASQNNLAIINLNKALSNMPNYFPDNIHPNEQGAEVIAKTISENINCR